MENYSKVDKNPNFSQIEENILAFWKAQKIFERSVTQREGGSDYVFYDGPPFATGLPHFGHFVPNTIKDIIPRYKSMCGFRVIRRFGWDCHGLPVEHEVEKSLGVSGSASIEAYGVGKFNEACRAIVVRYSSEWEQIITRMGRWVDFKNDYKTMDPNYMESIWWVFKQLWDRDLIYEGYYILPYSPGLATPLSNFEVNLGGYQMVDDPAITVRFPLLPSTQSQSLGLPANSSLLSWTTTPWTLPSNLGLAVGPEIPYLLVEDDQGSWLVAESRLHHYWRESESYRVVKRYLGADLAGLQYKPLFPYFADYAAQGAFVVHAASFVTTDEGSGIVHLAPAFGEDDYRILKDSAFPIALPLNRDCVFTAEVADFEGLFVKDADQKIIANLKARGLLVRNERYRHSYPFCYRTKKPLIYRAVSSWFVRVETLRERLSASNQQSHWVPHHLRDGRFGKWLSQARDWAISRNRYWGNPIPIWKNESGKEIVCIGSRAELEKYSGRPVTDLHKHIVDEYSWPAAEGGSMRRVPEVLDCWFESGAMPIAQNHYPFEAREYFEKNFPADFICEGLDQTRGWFYTLTVLAVALFDRPAFRNVVVNGLVLDSQGRKMSKSERNYSDPQEIINNFGADALRLFLIRSPVVRGEDLKYSDEGVKEVLRQIIIPLWNAYSFFVTYANVDGIKPAPLKEVPRNPFDQWLCSEVVRLVSLCRQHLDSYDLQRATDPIIEFIDNLNNWYIRRSRRRFWREQVNSDKQQAYNTLHYALIQLIMVAAPIIPFVTEEIWRNLRGSTMPSSVHLCDYPTVESNLRNEKLERRMRLCLTAVKLGRTLRRNHNLKMRQPLQTLYLISNNDQERAILTSMKEIIAEELNVKKVHIRSNEKEFVSYRLKPNYQLLGKRLGSQIKEVEKFIAHLGEQEIQSIIECATLSLNLNSEKLDISIDNIEIIRQAKGNMPVLTQGSLVAVIDPELTPQLQEEGLMRDLLRTIQRCRKEASLSLSERINLQLYAPSPLDDIAQRYATEISRETLATTFEVKQLIHGTNDNEKAVGPSSSRHSFNCTIESYPIHILITSQTVHN